jgi:hypothetical protein
MDGSSHPSKTGMIRKKRRSFSRMMVHLEKEAVTDSWYFFGYDEYLYLKKRIPLG